MTGEVGGGGRVRIKKIPLGEKFLPSPLKGEWFCFSFRENPNHHQTFTEFRTLSQEGAPDPEG